MVPMVILALLLYRPRNYCISRQPVSESLRSASPFPHPFTFIYSKSRPNPFYLNTALDADTDSDSDITT